jgi:hypothetical protein
MFEVVSSYQRTSNERGRRRRNEGFWRKGLDMNGRRRSNRKRRVRLRWRGKGSSEGPWRDDEGRGDNVGDGSEIGRSGGRNIGLDNQLRQDTFRIDRHFGE